MSLSASIQIPGYELISELGEGGMATVYLAVQTSLDRRVALKIMRRNSDDAEKLEKRFLLEGRTLAKLPHRNIVSAYDVVKNESATYISMEYLQGGTLQDRMRVGLSLGQAVAIVVQIAGALQFAHDHGIVHRDLKPANIMFRDDVTPVLTDFGIARQQDMESVRLTQTGVLVGTPAYMSPEQINALAVDGRSDLYSLGVIFYELMAGKPPFHGETSIAVLMAHLATPVPSLPSTYAEFQPILDRMLAKNRDERYASLKEFTKALKMVVIDNELLWARLQSDPDQSASEQLRALGFSVSIHAEYGLRQALPQHPLPENQAPSTAMVTPSVSKISRLGPISFLPSIYKKFRSSSHKRTLISALAACLLLAALASIWTLGHLDEDIDPRIKGDVDSRLMVVDRLISEGILTVNEGAQNALDMLQEQKLRVPHYSAVATRRDLLLDALKTRIRFNIDNGNWDDAQINLGFAAYYWPEDIELTAFEASIEKFIQESKLAVEVAQLIHEAELALAEGKPLGAHGAYGILARARAKFPDNGQLKQIHSNLMSRLLKPIKDWLSEGNFQLAENHLTALEPMLRNDMEWRQLQLQLNQLKQKRAMTEQIEMLYTRFQNHIREGQLLDPEGDNALETLEQVRDLDPDNIEFTVHADNLAAALTKTARSSLMAGQASIALQRLDMALRISPRHAAAIALKTKAETQLNSTQRQVAQLLGDIRQAIADRRFIPPQDNNAQTLLNQMEKLEPDNPVAHSLRDALPLRIQETVDTLVEQDSITVAISLVREAQASYPLDKKFDRLAIELDRQHRMTQYKKTRADKLDQILSAAAEKPIKFNHFSAAIHIASSLLAADPQDQEAITAKQRLFDSLVETSESAHTLTEVDFVKSLAEEFSRRFNADSGLAPLLAHLQASRGQLVAEEAVNTGELLLLANPWGKVESIIGTAKTSIPLPADSTTPLKMRLPAGVYQVTFSHPQAEDFTTQVVQVKKGADAMVAARFPNLTVEEYLRRAGF